MHPAIRVTFFFYPEYCIVYAAIYIIKLRNVLPHLNERQKKLVLAAEVKALGWGGVSRVAQATGVSRGTIYKALEEIESSPHVSGRIRKPGRGRKGIQVHHPDLLKDLESLVDSVTRRDPMSPLRWTCKSTRQLSGELVLQGYPVSHMTVAELLHHLDYSLQANAKTLEGAHHADRNEQFNYINTRVKEFLQRGQPVISVDTKKKEPVGIFKNGGGEWERKGKPQEVEIHDFATPESPKVIPYGIYDIGKNMGWVNVGCDHDTAYYFTIPNPTHNRISCRLTGRTRKEVYHQAGMGAGILALLPPACIPLTAGGRTLF
jgi:hypothetical protein